MPAFEDVSLEVLPGEVVALLGDNGAGKSTLIKIVSGSIPPSSGRVLVTSVPMARSSRCRRGSRAAAES